MSERFVAFLTVARLLSAKLGHSLMDVTVLDFWVSAQGLRVEFEYIHDKNLGSFSESLSVSRHEADDLVRAASS